MSELTPGVYEHFKGARYEVLGTGRHSETEEWYVFYRQLYGDGGCWVRPLAMFTEEVERDGYRGPRFRRVADQPASGTGVPESRSTTATAAGQYLA